MGRDRGKSSTGNVRGLVTGVLRTRDRVERERGALSQEFHVPRLPFFWSVTDLLTGVKEGIESKSVGRAGREESGLGAAGWQAGVFVYRGWW